jgi:hypothetical protein
MGQSAARYLNKRLAAYPLQKAAKLRLLAAPAFQRCTHPKGVILMTQFHEGQEVEALRLRDGDIHCRTWRKAKIVASDNDKDTPLYAVRFSDGTRAVFDADHIRPYDKRADKGTTARAASLSHKE